MPADNDSKASAATLREKAQKCRRLAAGAVKDPEATAQLSARADEQEAQAARLEANIRAAQTHAAVGRQILAELQQTSEEAKDAVRRVRPATTKPPQD